MKKTVLTLFTILLVISMGLKAQVFVVEHGSTTNTFSNIKAATDALQDDDKLYIPPGVFSFSGYTYNNGSFDYVSTIAITKRVHIYGGGYNQGGKSTVLSSGTLWLTNLAAGSTITGIKFGGTLILDNLTNVIVSRCMFDNQLVIRSSGANNIITECDLKDGISVNGNYGTIVSKCIIRDYCTADLTTFSNNTFTTIPHIMSNSVLQNNVFIASTNINPTTNYSVSGTNNNFSYNLWLGALAASSSPSNNNSIESNNIYGEYYLDAFVNYVGGDYHLKSTSLGHNAGIDGSDVGIFGTSTPFKENGLPAIPFFSVKSISSETNAAGKLPVSLKIEAQDR